MRSARVWSLAVCLAPCAGEVSGQALAFHCHFDVACDEQTNCNKTSTNAIVDAENMRFFFKGKGIPITLLKVKPRAFRIVAKTRQLRFDLGYDPNDPLLNEPAVLTVSRRGPIEADLGVLGGYFGTCEVN